ncbi:MAG: hypothetical protein UT89_C0009G0004 [Parcubacteria group bacterium GW2011_GWE1_40_20]|nr:MAG: hypothetical protein UT89_C0009G0004 [Parcubacteria group bacterium GW2011_GWE1_40_20]
MNKKNNVITKTDSPVPQLEAMIVLLAELLMQLSKDEKSAGNAREKAAVILTTGGLTQERAAKLVGIQKKKVVEANKAIKI